MEKEVEKIYKDLLDQYQKLTDQEKNAIRVYKSKLFDFINKITVIDNFLNMSSEEIFKKIPDNNIFVKEYQDYKKIVEKPENFFVKHSVFNDIDFTDILSFIDSLKKNYQIMNKAKDKIVLKDDLLVYRGVSLEENTKPNNIARGNIISTSINLDVVDQFISKEANKRKNLYLIKLKKGTPLLVTPYSIVAEYSNKQDIVECLQNNVAPELLKIVDKKAYGQQEIIIFEDSINILNIETNEVEKNNECLKIHKVETKPILNNKINLKQQKK